MEQEQVIRISKAVEDRLSCAQRAVRLSIHSSTAYAKMTKRETLFNHSLPTPSLRKRTSPQQDRWFRSHRHIGPEQRDKKFVWQIIYAYLTAYTKFRLKRLGYIACNLYVTRYRRGLSRDAVEQERSGEMYTRTRFQLFLLPRYAHTVLVANCAR